MDRASVFCLLVLLCSLSRAELQENKITDQIIVSPETPNVPEQPQPCPIDIHSALGDMSAALAEHRVRIEQVQALNKELEKKLKEVDTQLQAGKVAFSASLLASGSGFIGPFNVDTNLTFKYVISNIGNAYSPNTGFFIVPVRGAYHFEVYICSFGSNFHSSSAVLVKNGEPIFLVLEYGQSGHFSAANGATLLLEAGDVVFVRLLKNTKIFDSQQHLSTFSGHLLFLM